MSEGLSLKLSQKLDLRQGLQNVLLHELQTASEIAEEAAEDAEELSIAAAEASAVEPPGLEDVGDSDLAVSAASASLFDDPASTSTPVVASRAARFRLRFRIVREAAGTSLVVKELSGSGTYPARRTQTAVANAIRQHLQNEEEAGRRLESPGDWMKIRPIGDLETLFQLAGSDLNNARGAAAMLVRGFLVELPNGDVVCPDALIFPAGLKGAARLSTAAAVLASQGERPGASRSAPEGWTEADWVAFRRTASWTDKRGRGKT